MNAPPSGHAAAPSSSPPARTTPWTLSGWATAPVGAFALGCFLATFLSGVSGKLWLATDLAWEARVATGFVWFPVGIFSELLFAVVVAGVAGGLLRLGTLLRVPRVGRALGMAVAGLLVVANVAWWSVTHISMAVSQTMMTWQRIRGDDGVKVKDAHLVDTGDILPAVVWGAVTLLLVLGGLALLWRRRRFPVLSRRALLVLGVVALGVHLVDQELLRQRNFRLADQPVMLFVRSLVGLSKDDASSLKALSRKPNSTKEELLAFLKPQSGWRETQPPPRPTTTVKNAIVFFSEGVGLKHTSLHPSMKREDPTPNLLRRAEQQGLEMTRWYSPFHKSIASIFSLSCADFPPPNGKNIVEVNPRLDCGELSDVVKSHGFKAGLFHGGDFGFYDKLMLLGMRGYDVEKDARRLSNKERWFENEWGIDDRAIVEATLQWIDSLEENDRFVATLIPITAHYPYKLPPGVEPAFRGFGARARFLSDVRFLDDVFELLMKGLEERGLADETAVFFMADHGETVAEPPRASVGRRLLYEPSLRVPFVIVNPKLFPQGKKSDRLASHVDVLPTMLDVLGLPPDPRHVGQSVLSETFQPRRVFVGANYGGNYVGFVDGDLKFGVHRGTAFREVYDLATDPLELHNLAPSMDKAALDALTVDALSFAEGQQQRLQAMPPVAGTVDVQAEAVRVATVTVTQGETTTTCTPRDNDPNHGRDCGAAGDVFPGAARRHGVNATRNCIVIDAPAGGGTVKMTLSGQRFLPLVTRARFALLDAPEGAAPNPEVDARKFTVTAFADGEQGQQKTVWRKWPSKRIFFPSAQDELVIQVQAPAPLSAPLCLTLTEKDWRGE